MWFLTPLSTTCYAFPSFAVFLGGGFAHEVGSQQGRRGAAGSNMT